MDIEKIEEAVAAMHAAHDTVINSFSDKNRKIAVEEFIARIAYSDGYVIQNIMTAKHIDTWREEVFGNGNTVIRDFVLRLTYTFLVRWGGTSEKYRELAEVLAFAAAYDSSDEISLTPIEIRSRGESENSILTVIQNTKWMGAVLLLMAIIKGATWTQAGRKPEST